RARGVRTHGRERTLRRQSGSADRRDHGGGEARRPHPRHVERRFRRHPREVTRAPQGCAVILYLHGFNSSPHSHKAQVMGGYMAERGLAAQFACPALPPLACDAIHEIEKFALDRRVCLLGSSLGGFYATYLADKHGAKAVLI